MALVEYVEPISVGNIFGGLGALVMACVMAYILYRFYIKIAQWMDVVINREAKYEILEESFLDKIGEKKGIDLTKELVKRKMFDGGRKDSFRRKLEKQIYDEMFNKKS